MDVVHPSYVRSGDYTGDCAWIRQAVEEQSVCLPIAKIIISGPFGVLETEAAVSSNLPLPYPYLFSNKSEQLVTQRGLSFSNETVLALTRSRARALAGKLEYNSEEEVCSPAKPSEQPDASGEPDSARSQARKPEIETEERSSDPEEGDGILLSPVSTSFRSLSKVDRQTLIAEQEGDPSLREFHDSEREGIAKKNVSFQTRSGVLYRQYRDRKGKAFDQLVVPQRYRADLLHLAHDCSWSGHLGIKKTKALLTQEYYWPGCWKDVETFVRTCDACKRVGKSTDRLKAPMKLVPVITEPFRRLVIDIVGPLPQTQSGYRYILTALCPATKFPEAVPLKELSSTSVVDALLSIFARVGFPAEIQSDQGSIFTSALTTTFFEKCGITLVHSSVYHPQSNSVERLQSVLKRVLRALGVEQSRDWEACLPAAMFALRTAPDESTGFSPAELVYGRTLRTPLRMLRESWEGHGENQTVVEYVLELLTRLNDAKGIVEENMKRAQQKAKAYYDRSAKLRTFKVNDRVMILVPSRKNKLDVQWEGPARVVQKLSETIKLRS